MRYRSEEFFYLAKPRKTFDIMNAMASTMSKVSVNKNVVIITYMLKHLNIKIFGRVQGVFFRHFAKQKAERLNIKGFVRNENDNSVYIEVEAEEEKLKQFLDWCHQGPDLAKVEKVDSEFTSRIKNFDAFVVL